MSRYQLAAYLTVVIGLVSGAIYGIGHYSQSAYAYQIANGITPKLQEGSFWLMMNPQPFLYPGIALVIIGMAMAFHHTQKSLTAHTKQQSAVIKP